MPTAIVWTYRADQGRKEYVIQLQNHVTITGKEDHFALACHDANNVVAGMRLLADQEDMHFGIQKIEMN
ncbi:hypothetical protein HB779_17440 [Phyllobacterium sp. 628]|uniref:hypothetical protein n=1 Tax=Phyllobacterium sp. 628 TaxID=2718938 RepID=UPI001662577C|nr:hypothetical protein [Phyllobacterium sp. 628]QND53472.1 hypothetical protein HB779_17440 [Phyllobacterium sp. 628]